MAVGKELCFKPGISDQHDVMADSPEALAASGIQIHPEALNAYWGPDAASRYRQARGLAVEVQVTPGGSGILAKNL